MRNTDSKDTNTILTPDAPPSQFSHPPMLLLKSNEKVMDTSLTQ